MKWKCKTPRTFLLLTTAFALFLPNFGVHSASAAVQATPTLIVDMTEQTGEIIHGAAGFLYGISSEDVPTTNTLTPLKPKILATKGALGTEHPYGDALDVAKTFLESGGEQIQMYNSNYYAIFSPTPSAGEYADVLEHIIAPAVVEWKEAWKADHKEGPLSELDIDKAIVYLPINEGTPTWLGENQQDRNFYESWKIYYQAIKRADPNAVIGGPNDYDYNVNRYKAFLAFCKENNVLPDIFTWHELDTKDLRDMSDHIAEYRKWEAELDIPPRQVVINEYATPQDPGVPGRLVNWIARLEDAKMYGALPFWHQANNLNDLTADANEGNGAWWLYKWYGDMSGQTLKVEARNTNYNELYGLATVDDNKKNAMILFGGVDGRSTVALKNMDKTGSFKDAEKVNIKVSETQYTSFHGASLEPPVILEGTFAVENGSVTLEIEGMVSSSAYNITITEADEEDRVEQPFIGKYKAWYEAEHAQLLGRAQVTTSGSFYYFSGNGRVININNDGDGLKYTIDVPVDGKYKLDFHYGNGVGTNRGDEQKHAPVNLTQLLIVDGSQPIEMHMANTLLAEMFGLHTQYVDLKAGQHTLEVVKSGSLGGIAHDALSVRYAGAYGEELPAFNKVYEAELADFNTLYNNSSTQLRTENTLGRYSGNGYVWGLNQVPVTDGGGIRWNVIVEQSGLYNVSLHYQSTASGKANIYVGNTAKTLDRLVQQVDIDHTNKQWALTTAAIYLQKGINIVDLDASVDIALDYMRVEEASETDAARDWTRIVEAEDSIPAGSAIQTATTVQPAGTTYVIGMEGHPDADNDIDKYLEVKVNVPADGMYNMQVFQSNDDIFGTHSYNTKIIDKFASFQVNDNEPKRYFFINTFSKDTFKEKTIPVQLKAGENTIKVFNDDSWTVMKGIDNYEYEGNPDWYQDKPGDIPIKNYAPNFDKFIFTPAALAEPIEKERAYNVDVKHTAGGIAIADKNSVADGEAVTFTLYPQHGLEDIRVNGESRLSDVVEQRDGAFTLTLQNVESDLKGEIWFAVVPPDTQAENDSAMVRNNSFGTGDTSGWQVTGRPGVVENVALNRYHGDRYVRFSGDEAWNMTISQKISGLQNGYYKLGVYAKNVDDLEADKSIGESKDYYLFADNGQLRTKKDIRPGSEYTRNILWAEVIDGTLEIGVHVNAASDFEAFLDNFTLEPDSINPSLIDENILYFVDAGDLNPSTLSEGEKFGKYNSVTDQFYGYDENSGMYWGVVDRYAASSSHPTLLTGEQTWPAENVGATDSSPKQFTYRYARNQDSRWPDDVEARPGVPYKFELPNGQYEVEIGMLNQWSSQWKADVYFNKNKDTEKKVLAGIPIPNGAIERTLVIKDTALVTDRELTIDAKMTDLSSNTTMISYIIVRPLHQSIESIGIIPPAKQIYNIGDSLDLTGLAVTANYDGGPSERVTDYVVSSLDTSSDGIKTVVVTHRGKSASFTVTVMKKLEVMPYILATSGELDKSYGLKGKVNVSINSEAEIPSGPVRVAFQLLDGSVPIERIDVERKIVRNTSLSVYFNEVPKTSHTVEVYIYTITDDASPVYLSEVLTIE